MSRSFDLLVLGSGAAGLSVALHALERDPSLRVAVLAKAGLTEGSTARAQGGIAAVSDEADSFESHMEDTLKAGAGLCNPKAVELVAEEAPKVVDWLVRQGVKFDTDATGEFHLAREGGHSFRRILHAADATGAAIESALAAKLAQSGALIFVNHTAVDLVRERVLGSGLGRCIGAYVLDGSTGRIETFAARATVLATGGASRVYLYATNPDGSTGDGIAMAWRAGCRVANMEFSQFHPTCLYHPAARSFLISEAVRGEGGKLLRPDGRRFMDAYDPRGELAPRDIVARAIDDVMKRLGCECVYLDISHKPAAEIAKHFPTIQATCLKVGIDITRQPIPVVPAAHYTCGGVVTDLRGRTDIDGLYAVGEAASTGLHGANRLASNSLLECLVFGAEAAADLVARIKTLPAPPAIHPWDESNITDSDEEVMVSLNWDELRRLMWDLVGIVRTTKRLERARHRVDLLLAEIAEYYGRFRVTKDLLELRNLAVVADLIVRSAASRQESRGLHYTLDFPEPDPHNPPRDTVLEPPQFLARAPA